METGGKMPSKFHKTGSQETSHSAGTPFRAFLTRLGIRAANTCEKGPDLKRLSNGLLRRIVPSPAIFRRYGCGINGPTKGLCQ